MFFGSWWQGILFGLVTTIAMASLCYAYAIVWGKFTGEDKKSIITHDVHH